MRNHLIMLVLVTVSGCSKPSIDEEPAMNTRTTPVESSGTVGSLNRLLEVVNAGAEASWLTLDNDQRIALFGRHVDGFGDQRIYITVWDEESWSDPSLAPFALDMNERGARFSANGDRVYFSSTRPTHPDDEVGDWNLWAVDFTPQGHWETPVHLAEANSSSEDFHPSATLDGAVYFGSRRAESVGESDMFVARRTGRSWSVSPVAGLNTEYSEPDPYIARDGSYMIFARTDAPGGYGGDDLYISYASQDGWSVPRNLGSAVNSSEYEYGATVSPDNETLIFTTWRSGESKIALVKLSELGLR